MGEGVKGFLNNVQKNCGSGGIWLPLLSSWYFPTLQTADDADDADTDDGDADADDDNADADAHGVTVQLIFPNTPNCTLTATCASETKIQN